MTTIEPLNMPSAEEIFGPRLAPAPWLSSRPVIDLVVEILPTIKDDLAAELIEHLALTLVDRDDQLRAILAVLSSTFSLLHLEQAENVRLRRRNRDLRDARRLERGTHE